MGIAGRPAVLGETDPGGDIAEPIAHHTNAQPAGD